jgi:hypothetical protein
MEADPQVPDGYRQECLSGEAVDIAWVVSAGGSRPTRSRCVARRSIERLGELHSSDPYFEGQSRAVD